MMRPFLKSLLCVGSTLLLVSCGGKPVLAPPPTIVNVTLAADANVNPDARGRPTPVVVRTYLLANPGVFEAADFFSLFEGDEKALGATLVGREEVTLRPGQTQASKLSPQTEAKAVGVFVAYREPNKTQWRAVAAVPQNKTTAFTVTIGRDRVSIAPAR